MAVDAITILRDERIAQRLAGVNGRTYRVPFASTGPVHGWLIDFYDRISCWEPERASQVHHLPCNAIHVIGLNGD